MIEIKSTKNKRGEYEWCNCCKNKTNTKRIIFSQNGTSGTAIVLCDKCRKDLIKAIEESADVASLPPAQPEIVRCKDCKHREAKNGFCEGRGWPMQLVPDDAFCEKGERRDESRRDALVGDYFSRMKVDVSINPIMSYKAESEE